MLNITKPSILIQLLFPLGLILSGFWYIGSALTGILLLIAVVVGCKAILVRQIWQEYALSKLMLVYLTWLFVVAFTSTVPNTSMMSLGVLAGLPVLYLMVSNTLTYSEVWKKLRIVLFITAVGLALWAIWQVKNNVGYGYAVGPLVDRNAFAALMNLLWFPAAYLFLANKLKSSHKLTLILGGGLFIISTALFATSSRGGNGAWLLLLPVILWAGYRYNKSKQIIFITLCIALFAYFCSAVFLHSSVADRTFQIGPPAQKNSPTQAGQLSQDASTNARLMMWQSTAKMAMDYPLMGTGWGTFAGYYPAYRSPLENTTSGVAAHNDYLEFAATGGVPALLILVGIGLGLLFQLRKSLRCATENTSFEATALLLGVLALFIQAAVNFIFAFAFMNIIAGLYLARVAQLIDTPKVYKIPSFSQIRPAVKRLLAGFIILLVSLPFALHLVAQACLTGSQPGLKVINLIAPKVTTYNVANFITTIYPKEYISQQAMLQITEQFLTANASSTNVSNEFKRLLLNETIQRFELVRARSANNPIMGVREAKMLIEHHAMLSDDVAYPKAKQILMSNLKTDPYHANSMITLARLHAAQGNRAEAMRTLQYASNHIRTRKDQQLIAVETLRQLAAPKVIMELDEIEQKLGAVKSDSETGKPLILPPSLHENIDTRLNAIAAQIQQPQ